VVLRTVTVVGVGVTDATSGPGRSPVTSVMVASTSVLRGKAFVRGR
jgi:hypothetical protein